MNIASSYLKFDANLMIKLLVSETSVKTKRPELILIFYTFIVMLFRWRKRHACVLFILEMGTSETLEPVWEPKLIAYFYIFILIPNTLLSFLNVLIELSQPPQHSGLNAIVKTSIFSKFCLINSPILLINSSEYNL